MSEWEEVRARPEADADVLRQQALAADTHEEMLSLRAFAADIRAALQRVHELEQERRYHIQSQMMFQKRAESAEAKLVRVVEALREIEEGAGPFDRDPLKHASNCVEAMRATARAALDAAKGGE